MKLRRSIACGLLRAEHVGQRVTVSGWINNIRKIGGVAFVTLRDREGIVQITVPTDENPELAQHVAEVGREWVVAFAGTVRHRGDDANPDMPTGEVEIVAEEIEILNRAETPPIEIRDDAETSAELRLQYRYLDLRRPSMQSNFALRHRLIKAARDHLDELGFYEIETPILTKPTPEGARDFIVPARLVPGQFYALPQSPQIFKQLLMIAGFEKYFQFARCMRDEDKRGDRQPEHTQLDFEMSFVEVADVQNVIEGVIRRVMKATMDIDIPTPLPHLSYDEATSRFGSDKPDTRFEMELVDLHDEVKDCGFGVFSGAIADGKSVLALRIPGGHELVSKGQFKNLEKDAKGRGAKGLAFLRYTADGIDSPIAKFFDESELSAISQKLGAGAGDLVLFVADRKALGHQILSSFRNDFGTRLGLRDNSRFDYLWVDHFPQFEFDEESGEIIASHHPFVMPRNPEQLLELAGELRSSGGKPTDRAVDLALGITATQYDLVVNGVELGSGSIRITDPDVQDAMFVCLGIGDEEARAKFGFLLDALKYGAPPMAGIGIGVDRWLMVLLGLDTIQDVIAFPKTAGGKGLLDGCPAPADPKALEELGIHFSSE